jgi:hypothetical protein
MIVSLRDCSERQGRGSAMAKLNSGSNFKKLFSPRIILAALAVLPLFLNGYHQKLAVEAIILSVLR